MDKLTLTKLVRDRTAATYAEAKPIIDAAFQIMVEALRKGERIRIYELGTFEAPVRVGRKARNPKTGEMMHIAPRREARFKASSVLKKILQDASE